MVLNLSVILHSLSQLLVCNGVSWLTVIIKGLLHRAQSLQQIKLILALLPACESLPL